LYSRFLEYHLLVSLRPLDHILWPSVVGEGLAALKKAPCVLEKILLSTIINVHLLELDEKHYIYAHTKRNNRGTADKQKLDTYILKFYLQYIVL